MGPGYDLFFDCADEDTDDDGEWMCEKQGHRMQRQPMSDDFGVCGECGHEEREDA